ncbi:MAG: hypothetical protein KBG15_05490 [Kofleriaceae bacterium]|nr:hypothetical protein [Kofleriaceae bacterium]
MRLAHVLMGANIFLPWAWALTLARGSVIRPQPVSAVATHNLLVVSDLHFGEELLPGTSLEKRQIVELGARTFIEFLVYYQQRRENGRPWRLVVAGDLFDFMSVIVPGEVAEARRDRDVRLWGASRAGGAAVERMASVAQRHQAVLAQLIAFANAGNVIDIVVGNHDIELLDPAVATELSRQLLRIAGSRSDGLSRIRIAPWCVFVPGTVWIEHGHQHDEACSFEYGFAPTSPAASPAEHATFLTNVDYAAVRYLATTAPELDAHGAEQWSIVGYMRYAYHHGGLRAFARSYVHFVGSLLAARRQHQNRRQREARRAQHQARLAQVAADVGLSLPTAGALDRLGRAPLTTSWRRLAAMLSLDVWVVSGAGALVAILALTLVRWWLAIPLVFGVGAAVYASLRHLSRTHVASQLPMRRVPERIAAIANVPLVIFGHTHEPLRMKMPSGATYINCGTWLPAARPGLRRCFTHVRILPNRSPGETLRADILQWHNGAVRTYDANVG